METAKALAIRYFRAHAYSVTEIPESGSERADLDVKDTARQYIVEVKKKEDTGSQKSLSVVESHDGNVHVASEAMSRWDRLDNIIRKGASQISATPKSSGAFGIIWLQCDSFVDDLTARRALLTFYGIASLVEASPGNGRVSCLYFDHATAYYVPQVNGLVLAEQKAGQLSGQLCLNEYAPNFEDFRNSQLVRDFGNAKYDPVQLGISDGYIALRTDVSRSDESARLDELERAHGIRYRRANLIRHRYSV